MAINDKNSQHTTPNESTQQSSVTSRQTPQQSAQNSPDRRVGQQPNAAAMRRGRENTGLTDRSLLMPSLFDPASFLSINPFALMRRFTDEMDQMFENLGNDTGSTQPQRREIGANTRTFAPQVEMFERDNQLIVRADLPGLTKDNVQIEITDDGLVLTGERRYEHEESQTGFYRTERSYGTFTRRIPLPEGINAEEAKATFQNGVLEIAFQVPQTQSRSRRIQIEDASSNQTNAAPGSQTETANSTPQSDVQAKAKSA